MATTNIPPLDYQTPIVNPQSGVPSPQFIRLWQNMFANSGDIIAGLAGKADKTTTISTTSPLSGGGDLSTNRTISLDTSGVTADTYGDATHVARVTVDTFGRITAATEVAISGGGGGGTPPTIVQQATGRSAASNSTSITLTFPTATTSGNTVVFMVCGNSQSGTAWSVNQPYFREQMRNDPVNNQAFATLAMTVTTVNAGTSYTFNNAAANGGVNVLALELSGFTSSVVRASNPVTTGNTMEGVAVGSPGALNYIIFENDTNAGAPTASSPGFTLEFDGSVGPANHSGYFYSFDSDSSIGLRNDVTLTAGLSSPVYGCISLLGT